MPSLKTKFPAVAPQTMRAEPEPVAIAEPIVAPVLEAEPEPAPALLATALELPSEAAAPPLATEEPAVGEPTSFIELVEAAPENSPEPEPIAPEPPPRVLLPRRRPAVTAEAKQPPLFSSVPPEAPKPAKPVREKIAHAKQETLQFEPITRGRFEKSEPTIEEGQDLDVPTFLRKNVRVK